MTPPGTGSGTIRAPEALSPADATARADIRPPSFDDLPWPEGTTRFSIENLEGIPLFSAQLRSAEIETTGVFVFDTGAGYLGLDLELARKMGLTRGPSPDVGITRKPLPRFQIEALQMDQLFPVLTFDASIIRRATDRPVIGLLGQAPLMHRSVWLDYERSRMAIVPVPVERAAPTRGEKRTRASGPAGADGGARTRSSRQKSELPVIPDSIRVRVDASRDAHAGLLGARARAIPFVLAADGKILVRGRVANPDTGSMSESLRLIIDTGASRSVLFEEMSDPRVAHRDRWQSATGLRAPTLYGDARATLAFVPRFVLESETGDIGLPDVTIALIDGPLGRILSEAIGTPVHGLIGYSVLKSFRLGIDYVNRILWLEPLPPGWDARPHQDTHVGIQVERIAGRLEVTGVVEGSSAARAGVRVGDVIVRVGSQSADHYDVTRLTRALEGPAGTRVRLTIRRGALARNHRLVRESLF